MPKSSALNAPNSKSAIVKDVFEIKPQYNTGHETGLVAVLDRTVADRFDVLIGKTALVRTPAGRIFRVRIDDARDHGTVHSLFFTDLDIADMTINSSIDILDDLALPQDP